MGSELLTFYHDKLKKSWKLAFFSAFWIGLLVHIYKFTNLLPNHDSLYNFYSSQDMVASGRWFLSIACGFSSWFDLPWVIGILSLFFMGLTAAMVAEVFHMENPVLILLSSALLVSFPAITATMAFEFTADGYMLSMALAAFSTCLTRMEYIGRKHWKKLVLSGVCICLSCGIYQAYVSFAFILAVCYFMMELLENRRTDRELRHWIAAQVLIYGCALAAYYGIWKLCMSAAGIGATTYLNIDQVGVMTPSQLAGAAVTAVIHFVRFFLEWNILQHGVTVYSVLNMLFLAFFGIGLVYGAYKGGCLKRKQRAFLLLLSVVSLPFGCYIWMLTAPAVYYKTIMLQSVVVLYIFVAVLFEYLVRHTGCKACNAALALLTAIVMNNSVAANMSYTYMDLCYEKTYAAAVELSTRIHQLDDGTQRHIVLCGNLDFWQQEDYFDHSKLRQLGAWKELDRTILMPQYLSLYTDLDLSYYRIHRLEHPVVKNDLNIPAPYNWEFRSPVLGTEDGKIWAQKPEVQAMPVWPARDSVQVMGDTVVVKLSETEEQVS